MVKSDSPRILLSMTSRVKSAGIAFPPRASWLLVRHICILPSSDMIRLTPNDAAQLHFGGLNILSSRIINKPNLRDKTGVTVPPEIVHYANGLQRTRLVSGWLLGTNFALL
jgi:hypothetical protein